MAIITTHDSGAPVRITVEGSMTIYEAAEHKAELLAVLGDATVLELNLGEVDEADTAGLQLLLLARREAARAGKTLRVVRLGPALAEVLDRWGLRGDFTDAPPH